MAPDECALGSEAVGVANARRESGGRVFRRSGACYAGFFEAS